MIMRRFILLLLSLIALQASAQFSYSVKAGWSWSDIRHGTIYGTKSTPTIGGNVNYALNGYFGLQSGLTYKQVKQKELTDGGSKDYISTGHF